MTKLAAFLSALLTSAALAVGVSACVDDADGVGRLAPRSYDFEMEGFMYENSLAELFTACPDANWGWQTRWADVPEQPDWTVVQIELTGYVSDAHRLCLRPL